MPLPLLYATSRMQALRKRWCPATVILVVLLAFFVHGVTYSVVGDCPPIAGAALVTALRVVVVEDIPEYFVYGDKPVLICLIIGAERVGDVIPARVCGSIYVYIFIYLCI